MRLEEKNGAHGPAASSAPQNAPRQTVWQKNDEAIQWLGDHQPDSHWSQEKTQPLGPRWSPQRRRQQATKQAALIAERERRALGLGAGMGALLAVLVLVLALLFAAASGWLPGTLSPSSDSAPWSVPAQPARHTPDPAATNMPTSSAPPTTTAQPTATTVPTATDEPTATVPPTATVMPQSTPTTGQSPAP
jgi:hypothetical protein